MKPPITQYKDYGVPVKCSQVCTQQTHSQPHTPIVKTSKSPQPASLTLHHHKNNVADENQNNLSEQPSIAKPTALVVVELPQTPKDDLMRLYTMVPNGRCHRRLYSVKSEVACDAGVQFHDWKKCDRSVRVQSTHQRRVEIEPYDRQL